MTLPEKLTDKDTSTPRIAAMKYVEEVKAGVTSALAPIVSLPSVGDVRVIGGVAIIELVSDKQTRATGGYLDGVGPRLAAAFLERGLLLRPLGNIVYFMPPYVITDDEVDWAIDHIHAVLADDSANQG